MSDLFVRVFSDIHYGDRVSGVRTLSSLRPLLEGPAQIVLNGDTLDTRPSDHPATTAAQRLEVEDFFSRHAQAVTYLTGNHDTDLTHLHSLDLAGGRVFAIHGDVLFDDIVPWSQDGPLIKRLLREELGRLTGYERHALPEIMQAYRRIAGLMRQRHQVEKNPLKYAVQFAKDTVWPPTRGWRIVQAWRQAPELAAALLRRYRPGAEIILTGHTHRPGIWPQPGGIWVVNTGSFCPPLGGYAVDIFAERIVVRRIIERRGEYSAGRILREIPFAHGLEKRGSSA